MSDDKTKLNESRLGPELKERGFQIRAMIYQYVDGETYYDFGSFESTIPVTTAVTEVDALSVLNWAEISTVIGENDTGSVDIDETNLNKSDILKRSLGAKFDPKSEYNVLFFITTKGKGNQATMATTTPKGLTTGTKTEALKANALNAAKRTAVNKMLKALQKPMAGLLKGQGKENYAAMLNTPEGKALMAGVLGCLQLMLPQLQTEGAELIGDELRTQALSYVTDQVGDLLDPMIEAFGEAAESLPKVL